jgi:hypothetical protein
MKKIFILIIISALGMSSFSQDNLTALQYSMGFGTGNMHDFISKASFRGFTFDYRNLVQPNLGVGVEFGWNVFYDEIPEGTYEYQNLTISGKQWRYSNHFPMLGSFDYYIHPDDIVTGFVGLGLGTMYSLQNTDMGTYTYEKDAWHFAFRPELGVILKAGPGIGFTVNTKYYYGVKAGDLPSQGYFTINVGFVFVP